MKGFNHEFYEDAAEGDLLDSYEEQKKVYGPVDDAAEQQLHATLAVATALQSVAAQLHLIRLELAGINEEAQTIRNKIR
jgi:hypothetical protein